MLVYIPCYLLTFVGTFFAERFKNFYVNTKKVSYFIYFLLFVLLVFLSLFFVSAFRYNLGEDYAIVIKILENIQNGGEGFKEILTTSLAKLYFKLGLPIETHFYVISFLTIFGYCVGVFINKDNKFILPMMIIMFYAIFLNSLNQDRSGVGISLGLISFSLIYNYRNKWVIILSYLIALLSGFFHYSELINLFIITAYLLITKFNKKINTKILLTSLVILVAFAPLLYYGFINIIEYIPILKNYAYYFVPGRDTTATPVLKFFATFLIYLVPIINLIFVLLYFNKTDDGFMRFIIFIVFINMCFMVMGVLTNSVELADRTKSMFYMLEIFFVPYIIRNLKTKKEKITYFTLIGLSMIGISLSTFFTSGLYPYRFNFSKDLWIY